MTDFNVKLEIQKKQFKSSVKTFVSNPADLFS